MRGKLVKEDKGLSEVLKKKEKEKKEGSCCKSVRIQFLKIENKRKCIVN